MAHSNRKKLRDARGGMTRNQARKAKHANLAGTSASARMQQTLQWIEDNEQRKKQKASPTTVSGKIVRFPRTRKAMIRRRSALKRLEAQIATPTTVINDLGRIKKEIEILKQRT